MRFLHKLQGMQRSVTAPFLLAILIAVPILLISGCSSNPVAPDMNPAETSSAVLAESDPITSSVSAQVYAKTGGIVNLEWGSPANLLVVLPRTVTSDVVIEAAVNPVAAKAKGGYEYKSVEIDFGPDGLTFLMPALLVLDAQSLKLAGNSDTYKLSWFNPDTGKWEFQQASRVTFGKVFFKIYHFSKYGISN